MKKKCELCKVPARIFCESDQATLCWSCDAKVHSANFLVARHSRTLLCRTCLSPTPWKASGTTLANAASLCHRCHHLSSTTPSPPTSSTTQCSCVNHHASSSQTQTSTSTTSSSKRNRHSQEHDKDCASKRNRS